VSLKEEVVNSCWLQFLLFAEESCSLSDRVSVLERNHQEKWRNISKPSFIGMIP